MLKIFCFHSAASLAVKKPRRTGISTCSGITERLWFRPKRSRSCRLQSGRSQVKRRRSVGASQSEINTLIFTHVEQVPSVSSHDRRALHCGKTNQDLHRDAGHLQSSTPACRSGRDDAFTHKGALTALHVGSVYPHTQSV